MGDLTDQQNFTNTALLATAQAVSLRTKLLRSAPSVAIRQTAIVCDEHQDSSVDQHSVVMALLSAGAAVRIFGDPMQRIYGAKSDKVAREDRARWDALKALGANEKLITPHRWEDGCPRLGQWVVKARESLEHGVPIDLANDLPPSVRVLEGNNTSPKRTGYRHHHLSFDVEEGRSAFVTDVNRT